MDPSRDEEELGRKKQHMRERKMGKKRK